MKTMMIHLWKRMKATKGRFLFSMALCVFSVLFGTYIANQDIQSFRLEVMKDSNVLNQEGIELVEVNKITQSDLIMQKVDGLLLENGKIQTRKGVIDLAVLTQQQGNQTQDVGTKILGFMVMFLMMQSVVYMMLFGEDKETHMTTRIFLCGIRKRNYFASHVLFSWLFIYIPCMLCLGILQLFSIPIGYSLEKYAVLLAIYTLFSNVLIFFMYTIIKREDDANMICSALIVLTSLLSGSFLGIQKTSGILADLIELLPQKMFMKWGMGSIWNVEFIACFAILILLFTTLSLFRMRKQVY